MISTSQLPLIIRRFGPVGGRSGALSTLMPSIAPGHEHCACDAR
jgi:hypothetical protein